MMRLPDARARAALDEVAATDSDQRVRRDAAWAAAREMPCRSPED
jgi:hypothetical protein